jgi:hypothetical protein
MERLEKLIEDMNVNAFHGRGLHILWPRKTAFLFLEIEYYVSGPDSSQRRGTDGRCSERAGGVFLYFI